MSQNKKNNRRKALAVGLAVLGVAGLSLASAAQLQLNTTNADLVQAGVEDLTASTCQAGPINVTFTLAGAAPGTLTEGVNFGYNEGADAISLTDIDADCAGKNLEVALGDEDGNSLGEYATVVAGTSLSRALLDGFGPEVDADDIAQIAVTIYDN